MRSGPNRTSIQADPSTSSFAPRAFTAAALLIFVLAAGAAGAQTSFINWETPHVHPLDATPDGTRLLAVNTPDNRLEVFDLTGASPVSIGSVPVGVEPVSVRARSDQEVWVVNHLSDSVSVVDLGTMNVVATLDTADEPAGVVFAGDPERAFVSCSQANQILVFDPTQLDAEPTAIDIEGEDPRALAVNADGTEVYVAVFESGNATTLLSGAFRNPDRFPPDAVSHPDGPYGGQNPPPNDGDSFTPAIDPGLPEPPPVGLIVRRQDDGTWLDDNDGDWTSFVSGADAASSGRVAGWDIPDHDLAVIDSDTLEVRYVSGLMNACMALAFNPTQRRVDVVGTEAINEVRFEPNLNGIFVRVHLAGVDPKRARIESVVDLNPHLDYTTPTVEQAERDRSLGDPRGLVWSSDGQRGYVAGMGSNNVIVIDVDGNRVATTPRVDVGAGPTGLVLDEARDRLYVLNRFDATVSVVDTAAVTELERVAFYDPTPEVVRSGRPFLYDTHLTSGLGHLACASCHVDARTDRLAWDLGSPIGDVVSVADQNQGLDLPPLAQGFQDWHPMKGPMVTQTLQDIIGKEPLHWRGDRDGLEEFNPAYTNLQGDDIGLTTTEMQQLEDFLATIHFPPNPFRELDNSLPTDLPLPGHFTTGRFGPAGEPLPNGNAQAGLQVFLPPRVHRDNPSCVTCHTLPVGTGANMRWTFPGYEEIEPGPNGELHHTLVTTDGLSSKSTKVPQLRNLYEKTGFDLMHPASRMGFGYIQDGAIDSIERFVTEPAFDIRSVQETADLTAFLLAFSGSDLPRPAHDSILLQPPGPLSQDTHAAVGVQATLADGQDVPAELFERIEALVALAESEATGLVVKGVVDGLPRGYVYVGGDLFQSDVATQTVTSVALQRTAAPGSELTFTAVAKGTETRLGIDRDEDGAYDRDEIAACSDPADPDALPGTALDVSSGPLEAGVENTFTVECSLPGHAVELYYSLVGPGETQTPSGTVELDEAVLFTSAVTDVTGVASAATVLPEEWSGLSVWWQALDPAGPYLSDVETTVVE